MAEHGRSHCAFAFGLFAGLALPVVAGFAQVPTYSTFELQVRSNLCANPNEGTFNIPCDVFFANATPVLNDHGQFVVKLDVIGGTESQGVWFGEAGTGEIAYTSPAGASLSDPWVNNAGYVAFPRTFASPNGVYFYDHVTGTSGLLTTQPLGASSWASVAVNNDGVVGYRANFAGSGQGFFSYSATGTPSLATHAVEAGVDPQSPYSFLFSPAFNNNRQIAAQVRLGLPGQTGNNQPDQIRVFNADGSSMLIAEDRDSNPNSPYNSFDSSRPALLDDGRVAFIATLAAGGRSVFLSDGSTTVTIATTDWPQVSAIDFFPPHANSNGLVVFRGKDDAGLSAVFVGDGKTLRRVIGEHDIVPSDNGPARIDQNVASSPVFGGSVTINAHGDIAFHCALTPPDNNQIEWGSAIYIAYADAAAIPGDVNGDGSVNVSDLLAVISAWGDCPAKGACPADVAPQPDGDSVVNVADLLLIINNWG